MTSRRLLKLLAFAAIVAALWAIYIWWQTSETPPLWLRRAAFFLAAASVFIAISANDTRPRLVLRFLAALFALVAAIAFAADWSAPSVGGVRPDAKSLLNHLSAFTPTFLAALKSSITGALGSAAWDPLLVGVLNLPASVLFAILAALAGYAGRPRRQVQIYAN